MDWLRISLLILGLILIAGIWITHRLRTRRRRSERPLDLDEWGDDAGVHIRAHRDDRGVEPTLGTSATGLEPLFEKDDRPVRASTPRPESTAPSQPSIAEAERERSAPAAAEVPTAASMLAALRQRVAGGKAADAARSAGGTETVERPQIRAQAPGRPAVVEHHDDVSQPRVVGRNPLARGRDKEKILVLHVVAPRNRPFTGVALGAGLRRAGLKLGDMSIYHYRDAESGDDPLFSAANMVAPGTLTDEDLSDMMTPGVTLFLQLHACEQPHRAFEALLETAHVLARDLGGRVLDAQQSTATNQTLAHMREEMNQWLLRHRPELLRRKAGK